jgi:transposase
MPRAIAGETRRDIIRRHLDGQDLAQIATELRLSYDTVRTIWRLYRDRGEEGLATRYPSCGRSTPRSPEPILEAACRLIRIP